MITTTPIYAAVLAIIYVALSARVIVYRRQNRLSLGDEGDRSLLKRMRAHANFAEYVPLALVLLVLVELQGSPALAVHVLGVLLVAGRAIHAYGFSASPIIMPMRVWGMLLTFLMILLSALGLLGHALF